MFLDTGISLQDNRIINIRVQQQLTHSEIQALPLTNHLDDNATLKNDLFSTYDNYMQ